MKLSTPSSPTTTCVALLAALFITTAGAQQRERGIPARTALERIAAKHRPELAERIVEMKGRRGQTQPLEWWIVVHDERSPYRLRTMWVGDVRATDEGENDDFYPEKLPIGFANAKKLNIDSTKAFQVLAKEAERAKVGFDSVDYLLRAVEFSDEPLWSLTARDSGGLVVGRVMMSGFDGEIFRTVWLRKQPSGYPKITDSALDGRPKARRDRLDHDHAREPERPIVRSGAEPDVPELLPDPGDPGDPGTERAVIEPLDPE